MAVTLKDVEHVAALARLSFSDDEKQRLTHQLNDILKYMEHLNRLDTTNVEPLAQVIETHNVFREDEVWPCVARTEALRNAPAKTEEFFRVPKVIGEARRNTSEEP
jgi:aspartyl-tRNA(Asn)/glutamyl-tRNA(Gln) amidotransferase subunit C